LTPGCRFLKVECASHEGIQNKWYFFGNRATGQPGNRLKRQSIAALSTSSRFSFHPVATAATPQNRFFTPAEAAVPQNDGRFVRLTRRCPPKALLSPRRGVGCPKWQPVCPAATAAGL